MLLDAINVTEVTNPAARGEFLKLAQAFLQ